MLFYTVTKCSATNLLVLVLSIFYIDKSKRLLHQEVSTYVIIGFDFMYDDGMQFVLVFLSFERINELWCMNVYTCSY